MKTITIHVREGTYREFQRHARKLGRPAAELIREAMEEYLQTRLERQTSLRDWEPASVGEVLRPLAPGEDLLSEMLESGDD